MYDILQRAKAPQNRIQIILGDSPATLKMDEMAKSSSRCWQHVGGYPCWVVGIIGLVHLGPCRKSAALSHSNYVRIIPSKCFHF